MSWADAVDRRIRALLPAPQVVRGVVRSINETQVLVDGLGDEGVPCDWSSTFAAEIAASGSGLVGATVEVHYLTDSAGLQQPVIAYSITSGDK